MTDVTMLSPILMAGLRSASYKTKKSDRTLTGATLEMEITMLSPILMAGLRSASYKTKKSDRTLTGTTLEMEILSQFGESTLKDPKPSSMNHRKGSFIGQLIPVEYDPIDSF